MGLDVHFYNRKKIKPEHKVDGIDVLKEVSELSSDTELLQALKRLKEYTLLSEERLNECLVKAINQFVERESDFYDDRHCEVAYFRKFWWVLHFFGYADSDYANDKAVTKEQLEEAKNLAEKTIKMVIKHFTDKGFKIEHSPLEYIGKTSRWGGKQPEYLTFKNGILSGELEDEANEICSDIFDSEDAYLFCKVCEMYCQFSNILNETDWSNEQIVLNADW
jgi:hypothetical protein